MRVLYHHRTRGEDAQGIHIHELCKGFRNEGHEVSIVGLLARKEGTKLAQKSKEVSKREGNSLFNIPIPHWMYELIALGYNIPAFFVLFFRALGFRPHFIYERYSLFASAGYLVARIFKIPFVLEVNAPLSLEMKQHGGLTFEGLAQGMEDWIIGSADHTIVVTAAMRNIFVERGANPDKFIIMPNGVDREHFNPQVDGKKVKQKYGLTDKYVVGFVGWIRPWHGVDYLIHAVRECRDSIPSLRLLIVGDGPAIPSLKDQVEQLGLQDTVLFTGPVPSDDIPQYVAAMDVAVQPNVTEYASPIKLFEYLALGKAVIAPNKDNIREVVDDGKTALIYETGNIEQLARYIGTLYQDEELRTLLCRNAAALIDERGYYWRANARRVVEHVSSKIE